MVDFEAGGFASSRRMPLELATERWAIRNFWTLKQVQELADDADVILTHGLVEYG